MLALLAYLAFPRCQLPFSLQALREGRFLAAREDRCRVTRKPLIGIHLVSVYPTNCHLTRFSWSAHDPGLAPELSRSDKGRVISLVSRAHQSTFMGIRQVLARLNNSRRGDAESTDPTVTQRPRSQLAIRSSEPIPTTLQRRNSEGKQGRRSILWAVLRV